MHMMNFLFANSPPYIKQSKNVTPFSVLAFALWKLISVVLLGF